MATKKAGSNNLYDTNGDVIGFVDDDGGEVYFARVVDGVLMGPDGAVLKGAMVSGTWFSTPSVFRLRITGTGTVTIDAKDALGNITLAVATYTATSATDQIEFPYAGDNAIAVRATLTGTTTVEVI